MLTGGCTTRSSHGLLRHTLHLHATIAETRVPKLCTGNSARGYQPFQQTHSCNDQARLPNAKVAEVVDVEPCPNKRCSASLPACENPEANSPVPNPRIWVVLARSMNALLLEQGFSNVRVKLESVW